MLKFTKRFKYGGQRYEKDEVAPKKAGQHTRALVALGILQEVPDVQVKTLEPKKAYKRRDMVPEIVPKLEAEAVKAIEAPKEAPKPDAQEA